MFLNIIISIIVLITIFAFYWSLYRALRKDSMFIKGFYDDLFESNKRTTGCYSGFVGFKPEEITGNVDNKTKLKIKRFSKRKGFKSGVLKESTENLNKLI